MKQFLINYKVFQDTFLKPLTAQRLSATGVILGKREPDGRLLIYDVLLTPDAEESQQDIKKTLTLPSAKKNLRDLLNTKYTADLNYVTWLELFVESVSLIAK